MRKIVYSIILLLISIVPVYAGGTDLSLWGGYATFAMNDVNNFLKDSVGSGGSVTKVSDGYLFGADALFQVNGAPMLWLGPRVEYLGCTRGKASNATVDLKEDQYLIPILVGGKYQLAESGKFGLDGKAFLGVGLGYATTNSTSYSGTGFVGELGVGGTYKASSVISIGLDVGYRFADLGSMGSGGYGSSSSSTGTGTGTGTTYAKGLNNTPPLVNPVTGSNVKYDFSGMILNLGVTYHFK